MILNILLFVFIVSIVYFILELLKLLKQFSNNFAMITGYIIDLKAEGLISKAVINAELMTSLKDYKGLKRESYFMEQAESVCTDVFLMNGLNPKMYNFPALISICRYVLNLHPIQKGGEKIGSS